MSQDANRQLLEADRAQTTFGLSDLAFSFLRLGTLGLGGPIDVPTVMIGLVTLAILMITKKVPEPIVILAGAVGVFHGTVG